MPKKRRSVRKKRQEPQSLILSRNCLKPRITMPSRTSYARMTTLHFPRRLSEIIHIIPGIMILTGAVKDTESPYMRTVITITGSSMKMFAADTEC